MMRNKLIIYIVLIAGCLLLGGSIGNTAENVPALGVNILTGSINGTCFNDVNQDGQINQNEQGIPRVTVTLRRFSFIGFSFKNVTATETDAEGNYTFSVNRAGIYQIEETDLPGSTSTTPNTEVFFMGLFKTGRVILFGDILNNSQPTVSITADPPVIQKGGSSMLTWSSENGDTVTIDQGIGEVQAAGFLEVFPQETTTYTIIAVGKKGTAQASITVTVQNIVTTTSTIPNPPPPSTTTTTLTGGSHGGGGGGSTTTTTTAATSTTTSALETTTTTTSGGGVTTTTSVPTTTTTEPMTLIKLISFKATPGNKCVKLEWETESEIDNVGFNIYSAESEFGAYKRLNAELIAAKGSVTSGAAYDLTDAGLENRKTYFYKLEDIDVQGESTLYGPVSATPLFMYGISK
jgi:hypothetical protein